MGWGRNREGFYSCGQAHFILAKFRENQARMKKKWIFRTRFRVFILTLETGIL